MQKWGRTLSQRGLRALKESKYSTGTPGSHGPGLQPHSALYIPCDPEHIPPVWGQREYYNLLVMPAGCCNPLVMPAMGAG